MRAYENNNKYYLDAGLSRQNIYAEKSQKQDFLLVSIDIDFMVEN